MSKANKPVKTAVEACREVSKSLKEQVVQYKSLNKTELSPRDAGLKVTKAILNQIKSYAEQLQKMQKLETAEALKKSGNADPGLPYDPAKSNNQFDGMFQKDELEKGKSHAASAAPKVPGDPAWDKGYNVMHEAGHGTYRTTGGLQAGAAPSLVEVQYAPRGSGKFGSLGHFPSKQLAAGARIAHHDRISAGFKKEEGAFDKLGPDDKGKARQSVVAPAVKTPEAAKPKFTMADVKAGKSALASQGIKQPKSVKEIKKGEESHSESTSTEDSSYGDPVSGTGGEMSTSDDTEALAHPIDTKAAMERHPEAKLPGDKDPKRQDAKKTGSGGQIKAGKKLKKGESPVLAKAGIPKLTGKDPASKMMSQHAQIAGSADAMKNKKMPAAQQSMKMPSPQEHAGRADDMASFMPKGKWSKSEWDTEKCMYCKSEMHDGAC